MVPRADCSNMGSDREGGLDYCALHRRCEGEWTRWAADETAPVTERAAVSIDAGPRIDAAGLLHRFRLYQRLGGYGDAGGVTDAR